MFPTSNIITEVWHHHQLLISLTLDTKIAPDICNIYLKPTLISSWPLMSPSKPEMLYSWHHPESSHLWHTSSFILILTGTCDFTSAITSWDISSDVANDVKHSPHISSDIANGGKHSPHITDHKYHILTSPPSPNTIVDLTTHLWLHLWYTLPPLLIIYSTISLSSDFIVIIISVI